MGVIRTGGFAAPRLVFISARRRREGLYGRFRVARVGVAAPARLVYGRCLAGPGRVF